MASLPAKPRVEIRRRWILWVLLVVFIWLVVSNLPGIERFFQILSTGRWQWILAAVLAQGIYYILYSGVYLLAFEAVEVKSRLRDLLPVVFGSVFVNVAAPTGGASGAALFIDDAAKRGQSPARAAAGTLLVMIANLSAFTLVLLGGLAYLSTKHNVQPFELAGAAILLLVSGGSSGVLLFGLSRPSRLQRWPG